MSKPISLFSGYSQKENRTTNYCMLILKLIYEENPKYFGEVVNALLGDGSGNLIGVNFSQQEKRELSIPDAQIIQKEFSIFIETKNNGNFGEDQLLRHIDGIKGSSSNRPVLLALSKIENKEDGLFVSVKEVANKNGVNFVVASFNDFAAAIRIEQLPKNLRDTIDDFYEYLDQEDLLSTWHDWLDVVNCVGIPDDILIHKVYMCPAQGGAYSHSRCKYFGMYRSKNVEVVSEIRAVVEVDEGNVASLLWANTSENKEQLIKEAIQKVNDVRDDFPTRCFLLGDLHETKFIKDSPGGMMGSKQYFNIKSLNCKDSRQLAVALNGKNWSDFSS